MLATFLQVIYQTFHQESMLFSINYGSHPLGKAEQQGEEKQVAEGLGLAEVGGVEVLNWMLIQMY